MRLLHLLFFLFLAVICVNGQRRTIAKNETSDAQQSHSPSRGRGRSRFSATQEFAQSSEPPKPSEPSSRRATSSRKRVSEATERRAPASRTSEKPQLKNGYEVEEIINESPIDPFKRQSKPRVLTETHYETLNAPKRKLIDPVQAISETPDLFKTFDNIADTDLPETSSPQSVTNEVLEELADTTFKTNSLDISSDLPKSNEITKDLTSTRTQPITTSKPTDNRRPQKGARRANVRPRNSVEVGNEDPSTPATRSRTRTRPTKRPEEVPAQSSVTRTAPRSSRRRPESSTQIVEASRKGPSLFVAEESQEVSRFRTGRRNGVTAPQKISNELFSKNRDVNRTRTATPRTTTTSRSNENSKARSTSRFQSRSSESSPSSSRGKFRSRDVVPAVNEFVASTESSKTQFGSRDDPPVIDEQKLEVLPLFAAEPKTVRPVTKPRSKSRTRSINTSDETFQMSATDNDLKMAKPQDGSPRVTVSRSQTVNVETRTETSFRRKVVTRKPVVKESVVAEVSEVTSKRTVSRKKSNEGAKENTLAMKVKVGKPKVSVSQTVTSSRGKKKSEISLSGVSKGGSGEEFDESDNYPEPFKALIQAKKNEKESRPSPRPHTVAPSITTIVTSSVAPTTVAVSSEATKEADDLENEVDPTPSSTTTKSSSKSTRQRFSLTTKSPVTRSTSTTTKRSIFPSRKVVRSTASPASSVFPQKEHKFHAKFTSKSSTRSEGSPNTSGRGSSHPRGLYSSRKQKDDSRGKVTKLPPEPTLFSTQIPKSSAAFKKSSRYSSKYRNDISSRGHSARSTTNPPVYIPTLPTLAIKSTTPTRVSSRTTVESGAGTMDADLGLEIISFDDPVNTVPSANLINGDLISSTENALNNPSTLVKDGTTEKPVSIIERIINSITAISTTTPPDTLKQTSTASTTESSSAILKLAPKKSTRLDRTKTKLDETSQTYPIGTVSFTTERPTTIIERILSSLSAIQATDDTNSNQVGKDFNTISSPPTTPVSRVTKPSTSRTTLPAQISTSINPLSVLDELSPDQVLQKRTIGKLLALLNGLVSTELPQKLVVVTPKSNFVTGVNTVAASSLSITSDSTSPTSASLTTLTTTLPPPSISNTSSVTAATVPPITSTSTSGTEIATLSSSSAQPPTITTDTVATLSIATSTASSTRTSTSATEISTPAESTTLQLFTSAVDASSGKTQQSDEVTIQSRFANVAAEITSAPLNISVTQAVTTGAMGTTETQATTQPITQVSTDMDLLTTQTEATIQTTVPPTTQSTAEGANTDVQVDNTVTPQTDNLTQQDISGLGVVPLSLDSSITTSLLESTTTTPTFPSATEVGLSGSTDTDTLFTYLSTIPTIQNFEVSPGSVSIFSANDLSNSITTDDSFFSTITIAGRSNFETTVTTESTTIPFVTTDATTSVSSVDGTSMSLVESSTVTPQDNGITTQSPTTQSTASEVAVTPDSTSQIITTIDATTEASILSTSTSETAPISSSDNSSSSNASISSTTTEMTNTSNQTSANSLPNNISPSNRSGRLLNIVQEPVQNSLDFVTPSTTTSTTPDYFIFAVLNNNTILRKKPPTIPNKDTPFVIVGLYPNNTVVRKFPNGTLVPMEQIIRVRGFDTRENPPPLPEITSNQVTNDPGSSADNKRVQTVDQNTIPSVEANPLSLNVATSSSTAQPLTITTATVAPLSTAASTATSTSSTTTTPSSTASSSTTQSSTTVSTESSVSSTVNSTPAQSTTVAQITNAATTTLVNTVPASTSAAPAASSTTLASSTTPNPTLPTLSELLNGRTLEAFNNIFNQSNANANTNTNTNYQTLQVNQNTTSGVPTQPTPVLTPGTASAPVGTTTTVFTVAPLEITPQVRKIAEASRPVSLSNRILENTTPQATTITTNQPVTTPPPTTAPTTTRRPTPTTRITTTPVAPTLNTTPEPTSTVFPSFPTATFFPTFPTFFTTLFPNILRITPESPTTRAVPFTTITPRDSETITASATTLQPTTVVSSRRGRIRDSTTTIAPAITTTQRRTTTQAPTTLRTTTTTTPIPTTTISTTTTTTTTPAPTTTTTTTTTTPAPTTTTTTTTTPTPTTTTTTTTTPAPTTTTTTTTTTPAPTTTTTTTTTTTPPPTTTTTAAPITTTSAPQATEFFSSTRISVPLAAPSTIVSLTTAAPVDSTTKKLKQLTEQQKKDLETLAQLEKEQAALLQQLTLLTSLNFGGNRNGAKRGSNNLADRVIKLAVERDKSTTTTTVKTPDSIQAQLSAIVESTQAKTNTPNIEDVLKQYNLSGVDIPSPTVDIPSVPSTYGKSNDAILAAILKEQGIAPPTPKSLADQIKQAGIFSETTTKKPKSKPRTTTQRPPGRLMQGLNWLLNVLSPPPQTTRKPKPVKPKKPPVDQELLANSPTRLTPVVTSAPRPFSPNALSQDDIQKLIKQLEAVQKDPKNTDLDLSQIKSLQNLINTNEGVEVMTNGQNGATSRLTTTELATTKKKSSTQERGLKFTTPLPSSISNSVDDDVEEDFETTTVKARPALPPVRLRPVPGVDDNSDPLIRGNLITAAVNVTRAISGFLGTALQGAAQSFQSLLGSGSRFSQASSSRPG